jgi:Recombinase zinc beta ribbon domain
MSKRLPAYAYGKSEMRIEIVEGRARKSYGHGRPPDEWEVLLKDHHEGYIDWGEFDRNQTQLASNAYGLVGGPKSGRGGSALLSGLITCGRCGRRLAVAYTGRCSRRPVYRCDRPNQMLGRPRCLGFGGSRIEAAIAREVLLVVEPMAVEAALEAERRRMERRDDRQRIADLEVQQARYEASLAERRYAACDPDHRLIAAQLEKSWEASLQRRAGKPRSSGSRPAKPGLKGWRRQRPSKRRISRAWPTTSKRPGMRPV